MTFRCEGGGASKGKNKGGIVKEKRKQEDEELEFISCDTIVQKGKTKGHRGSLLKGEKPKN
jgi:hypothetical protein